MIPFYDLKYQHKDFDKEFINSLKKTLNKKDFILGDEVSKF